MNVNPTREWSSGTGTDSDTDAEKANSRVGRAGYTAGHVTSRPRKAYPLMAVDRRAEEQQLVALMIAYQKGDMDAFTGLYEALKRPLIRYLWTFVRNQTMAEDLLQETFLQLHRARQTQKV